MRTSARLASRVYSLICRYHDVRVDAAKSLQSCQEGQHPATPALTVDHGVEASLGCKVRPCVNTQGNTQTPLPKALSDTSLTKARMATCGSCVLWWILSICTWPETAHFSFEGCVAGETNNSHRRKWDLTSEPQNARRAAALSELNRSSVSFGACVSHFWDPVPTRSNLR